MCCTIVLFVFICFVCLLSKPLVYCGCSLYVAAVPASRCHNPNMKYRSVQPYPHMAQEVWGARGRRPQLRQRTQKTKKRKAKKRKKDTRRTQRKAQRRSTKKAQREQTKSPDEERWSYKREYTPPLSLKSSPKGLAVPRWQMGFEGWISR